MGSVLDGVNVHLVDSIDDTWALQAWLGERRPVLAVDTETEGINWWREKVRLIQVGDAMNGWAIPWDLWGGAALDVLGKYDGPLVMHNAGFDVKMVERWCGYRFDRSKIHDTRVLAHILDPAKPTGLKPLSARTIDPHAAHAQKTLDEGMRAHGWTWATVPLEFTPYWVYAGLDCVLTARIWEELYPQVMSTAPAAYDLEMATTWVIVDMETKGVALDVDFTREKLASFEGYVDKLESWCVSEFGVKPGSNQAVIERLASDTGYPFTKLTGQGKKALDKDVLADVVAKTSHPLAEVVAERRKVQKLAGSYLRNFLEFEHEGRIHPSFNLLKGEGSGYGARTGRMSVSNPALQQLPRKSKDGKNPAADEVRRCLTASPGNLLIMCDFDQIEARMFAHFCQDPGMLAAFDSGDFFTNMARMIFRDPTIEKSDWRRPQVKNAMYAKIYGAGPAKFAATAGISEADGEAMFALLTSTFPGIDTFSHHIVDMAKARYRAEGVAYVTSPITGRRHVADWDREYALVNYLVQGTAAEVLKLKDVELRSAGLGPLMVLNVHDEVILDVPEADVPEVVRLVESIMYDDKLFSVPLTAGTDVAFRWGDK